MKTLTGIHGIREGPRAMRAGEDILYGLDVSDIGTSGGAVSSPTMKAYRVSDGSDVSDTVLSGTMSVSEQIITLKRIASLTEGERYRMVVGFSKDGSGLEVKFPVSCPRD